MRKAKIDKLKTVLDSPLYMFFRGKAGIICDKLELLESSVRRTRYFILGNNHCSCLGFSKAGGCKHLKMLSLDSSFIKYPASRSSVIEEVRKICNELDLTMPEVDESSLPERIGHVVLDLPERKDAVLLVSVKSFSDGSKVCLFFKE